MKLLKRLRRGLAGLARSVPSEQGKALICSRCIYILPTGAGIVFGAILLLMLLGSLNYQNNLGLLFTFLTASIVLVAMHHTWFNLLGIAVYSRGGAPVFCGEHAVFSIDLVNVNKQGRINLTAVRGSAISRPRDIEPSGEATMQLRLATTHRGELRLGRIRLETRYPLGLFRAWCYVMTEAETTVYPHPAEHSPSPPPSPTYRQSANGDRGVGADDFLGLRSYRTGDSPRRLDWKAYGREQGLLVKQFGGDRADHIWLDWNRLSAADTETRLSLLCRQVLDAALAQQTFGLRLPGQEITMGQGDGHKHRCLQALSHFGHG